jgi:hypothetical protein
VAAGRLTIPLGYYNRHYFYPFQRNTITPPFFQSTVIGLPIADHGVVISKTFTAGSLGFFAAGYVVNGYGSARTASGAASTDTFRPGLGTRDTLLIANNLRDLDVNDKPAFGGNFRVMFPAESEDVKIGVSSYQGAWSPDGKSDFSMLNAYLSAKCGPVTLLAEGLRTDTDNDRGVLGFYSVMDWKSTGGFLEADWSVAKREDGEEWILFAATESTLAEGKGSGAAGIERLTQTKGGVSWRVNQNMMIKSELSQFSYSLPFVFNGATEQILLRQRALQLSLTLTY